MQLFGQRKGSTALWVLIGVVILAVIIGVVFLLQTRTKEQVSTTTTPQTTTQTPAKSATPEQTTTTKAPMWMWSGTVWQASSTPAACATPITFKAPADLSKATAVLYPGQTRGGNYKPHGGLRFDGVKNNAITVSVPMDAYVVDGSRYIEAGETQYMFDFEVACGLRYRFDHLLTLSPAFQALADTLPAAKVDDSRTTNFSTALAVKAGDPIATAVGFSKTSNVSFDWGVYDLRAKNTASTDATWVAAHDAQLAHYGVCWFDMLSTADEATVRALPAGDSTSGKTSDFCK